MDIAELEKLMPSNSEEIKGLKLGYEQIKAEKDKQIDKSYENLAKNINSKINTNTTHKKEEIVKVKVEKFLDVVKIYIFMIINLITSIYERVMNLTNYTINKAKYLAFEYPFVLSKAILDKTVIHPITLIKNKILYFKQKLM